MMRRVGLMMASMAIIATLTGGMPAAAAQATPADHPGNSKIAVTRGAAGEIMIRLPGRTSPVSVNAPAPTTSPAAAQRYWVARGSSDPIWCQTGYACALVPYGDGWYVFKFYNYGTYRLSYWYGWGWLANNQTGGAAVRVLDINGRQLICKPPPDQYNWSVNWDPAWYVRLTSSPC